MVKVCRLQVKMSTSEWTFKPAQSKEPAQPKEPVQHTAPSEKFKENMQTKEKCFDCVYAHWKAQISNNAFRDLQELNKVIQEEAVCNLAVDCLEEETLPFSSSSYGGSSPCNHQRGNEQQEAQQESKRLLAPISTEFNKELKAAARTKEEVPPTEQFANQQEHAVRSLVAKCTLVHLKGTGASISVQMNKQAEAVKVTKTVVAMKAGKVREPAATKKAKKVPKKPATKKSPKKPAVKKAAAKGPKKPAGIPGKMKDQGNKVNNWRGKKKPSKRKDMMNFKKYRKKSLPLKDAKVGGKSGRPPD